jgi:alkylhydroperoxidase family enzyme
MPSAILPRAGTLDAMPAPETAGDFLLAEWVRLRVCQILGFIWGEETHAATLRDQGESWDKIKEVEFWPVSDLFNAREQMALALAEMISLSEEAITPGMLVKMNAMFQKEEIIQLVLAIQSVHEAIEFPLARKG